MDLVEDLFSLLAGRLTTAFPTLPREKALDYVYAAIIAILFPLFRYILDKTLYQV